MKKKSDENKIKLDMRHANAQISLYFSAVYWESSMTLNKL